MSFPEPNSRAREKQNQLNTIIKGYPLTSTPVVPNILKHQMDFERIEGLGGIKKVGYTLSPTSLVEPESIEVIRKKILEWHPSTPGFTDQFQTPLPGNLIAVSVSYINFEVGGSCNEFRLCNGYKEAVSSGYTYRKMSECLQCCYYNENGVEFLAGMTFYPAPNGSPKLLKSNNALLYIANGSVVPYPLGDRNESRNMVRYKKYGRYCTSAGRQVMIQLDKKGQDPLHLVFDHVTKEWKNTWCKECSGDFFTYKWEEPKEIESSANISSASQDAPAAPATEHASTAAPPTVDAPASTTEPSTVSRADSTESLLEGFDMIEMKDGDDDDDDSDIDAELID